MVYSLVTTTRDLRSLISMHEIEDIRQEFRYAVQKVRGHVESSSAEFSERLDDIIVNAKSVDSMIAKCHTCHHTPTVEARITQTEGLVSSFKEKLSFLITSSYSNDATWKEHRKQVAQLGDIILEMVEEMVQQAAATIQRRTNEAIEHIDRTYQLLAFILIATFGISFFATRYLTRRIAMPIDALLKGARQITEANFGYQTDFQAPGEFGELIRSFNQMSLALADNHDRLERHFARLNQLNEVTVPLHSAQDMNSVLAYVSSCIFQLLGVEQSGVLVSVDRGVLFVLHLAAEGTETCAMARNVDKDIVREIYSGHRGQPVLLNNAQNSDWPFGEKIDGISLHSLVLTWLTKDDEVIGALLAINKREGGFFEEDMKVLSILANNISVAVENIVLYRDLEERMEELKRTQRSLAAAEKLTALGTLSGGIAHDFNNILCGLMGYVGLLKRNHSPEDRDYQMLDVIEKASLRAANLTRQLLTFARQGKQVEQPVDLNDSVANVKKLLENTISKMIVIDLALTSPLPPVLGDPTQLEQVIMNLSLNARDSMPEGGRLGFATRLVTVDEQFCEAHAEATPGDYIELVVADTGTGMDARTMARIFEPFFTTKDFGKGTGLGLAMVYGIVQSHDGFCLVDSAPGKGTSFSVFLPTTQCSVEVGGETPSEDRKLGGTILVVDDEQVISEMLGKYLEYLGCTALFAANGADALGLLIEHREQIDLVVLDINMPVMGGEETYRRIKEIKPEVKVLVSSGYALEGKTRAVLEGGAQGFIQKPYRLEDFAAKVRQVLALSRT